MKIIHGISFPDWDNHFKSYFNNRVGYQEEQRNRALSKVKKFEIAIDCGAHVGLWSKDLLNLFDKVYCFEPNIECFECLKINIKNDNKILINKGLGKEKSIQKLHVPISLGNSGNSQIVKNNYLIKNKLDKIVDIEIVTLDQFELKKIDFIKIDVENFGFDVLRGAKKTLKKCNPVICLELVDRYNKQKQIDYLKNLGYYLVDIVTKEHIFIKN